MSTEKFKIVARLGLAAGIPLLINGEIGWDTDVKIFRVGDDTVTPTQIVTSKSIGYVTYLQQLTVKYGNIDMFDGGKVDGIDLSTMNQTNGLVLRTADGVLANKLLVGEAGFTVVTNSDGAADGDVVVTLDPTVKALLTAGGNTQFTWGRDFPVDSSIYPGHLHFNDTEELVYIRAKQTDLTEFWLDISSAGGRGGGGINFFFRSTPPQEAKVGDEWFDSEQKRLYMRMSEDGNIFWVERRF
jgi:hypothetical protein